MNRVNTIDAKKKLRRRFKSETKKINKNVKFYYYLKLINIFKRTTLVARFY